MAVIACTLMALPSPAQQVPFGGTFHIKPDQSVVIYGQRSVDCGHNPPFFLWVLSRALSEKPEYGVLSDGGTGEGYSSTCEGPVPVRAVVYTPDRDKVLARARKERKSIIKDTVGFWNSNGDTAIIYIDSGLEFAEPPDTDSIASSVAGTTGEPGPWDGSTPVTAPVMEVGDSWVFEGFSSVHGKDTYSEKIIETGKGGYVISQVSEVDEHRRLISIDTNKSYPNLILVDGLEFPLSVGKKWQRRFEGKSVEGRIHKYINTYKVLKIEQKTVKAGTFLTLKIRNSQKIIDELKPHNKYIWYAPDAKRIILTKPGWRRGEELVSYELSSGR